MKISWVFTDGSSIYTLEMNPNRMGTGPDVLHQTDVFPRSPLDGTVRHFRRPPRPWTWDFSGVLRTKSQYDAMQSWFDNSKLFYIVDHLGVVRRVRFQAFNPESRPRSRGSDWRYSYTAKVLVYPPQSTQLDSLDTPPTGTVTDTVTFFEGVASAKKTSLTTAAAAPFTNYSFGGSPVTDTFSPTVDMRFSPGLTLRIQWPGLSSSVNAQFTLTLTSATGNANLTGSVTFGTADSHWHLVTFPINGPIGALTLSAITGYQLQMAAASLDAAQPQIMRFDDLRKLV